MLKSKSQFNVSMNPEKILNKTSVNTKKSGTIKSTVKIKPKKQSEMERNATTPQIRVQIKVKGEEKPSYNPSRLNKREYSDLSRELSPKLKRSNLNKEEKKTKPKKTKENTQKAKKKKSSKADLAKSKKLFLKKSPEIRHRKKFSESIIIRPPIKRKKNASLVHEVYKKMKKKKNKLSEHCTELINITDGNQKENFEDMKDKLEHLQCDLIRTKHLISAGSSHSDSDRDFTENHEWNFLLQEKSIQSDLVEQFKLKLREKEQKPSLAESGLEIPKLALTNLKSSSSLQSELSMISSEEDADQSLISWKDLSSDSFKDFCPDTQFLKPLPIAVVSEHFDTEPSQPSFHDHLLRDPEFEAEISQLIRRETKNYLKLISFKVTSPEVNPKVEFIEEVLEALLLTLLEEENEFLDIINTPVYPDPMEKLSELRARTHSSKVPSMDLILSYSHISLLKFKFNPKDIYSRNLYLQMLFDCTNEALNYVRPYGMQGVPYPWSNKALKIVGESYIEKILDKVHESLFTWASVKAGLIPENGLVGDVFEQMRENCLNTMICDDVARSESHWHDYEDEETQIIMNLEELVVDSLVLELVRILNTS